MNLSEDLGFELDMSFLSRRSQTDMWMYLANLVDRLPSEVSTIKISEYAERKRVLPSGTPFPGPWRNERTPYLTEIMDCMSVLSPVQHIAIQKGAQLGLTAAAENVVCYFMDAVPSEIMFVSATDPLVREWAAKRLEPAIDTCGFRHKFTSQAAMKATRRGGDRTLSKEFMGGSLVMVSAQSAPSLRSASKRVLIRDEINGAPSQLRTGEGNWLDVSFARTMSFGNKRKIMDFSTPTLYPDEAINRLYEQGDQRKFRVACPHCGGYQFLEWGSETGASGIRADTEAGRVTRVYYQCEHCREPIEDHHKHMLLSSGHWEPTSQSNSPYFRSYQISSLYSPAGMLSWYDMFQKFQAASNDPDGMRSFRNLYLGEPYRESGERPDVRNVYELRSNYRSGTVPNGVLYVTAGIDIQRGSEREKSNPRVEVEICGHGKNFRTWSIAYYTFEGSISDPYDGAWLELKDFVSRGGFRFKSSDEKKAFDVQMIFVDSGDGTLTDVVYQFTRSWGNTFPCKGTQQLKGQKRGYNSSKEKDKEDHIDSMNVKRYRKTKVGEDLSLYVISTNYYKHNIYNNITNTYRHLEDPDRPGVCQFPTDYPDSYFEQLTAEDKRSDGSFHCPSGRRNEALDCRVMNLCAGDVYLDSMVFQMKVAAKANGGKERDVDKINHRHVLQLLEQKTYPKTPAKRT
jgi:phage terminase large subunit GpA-like protein